MSFQKELFSSMGVSLDTKKNIELHEKWNCYSLNDENPSNEIPIILIIRGPKNTEEIKKHVKGFQSCIIFFKEKNVLFFKSFDESYITVLENDSEYQQISSILRSVDMANAQDGIDLQLAIKKLIDKIPNATGDFVNKGLFSTHYLRGRIFTDTRQNIDSNLDRIRPNIGNAEKLLNSLGWDISNSSGSYHNGNVTITVTKQDDFSIRENESDVAPSYTAVATLRQSQWAILTNGKKWRLYSAKISASSTNYFEIVLDPEHDSITKYLIMLFNESSFKKIDGKIDIDVFFEEGKNYAKNLEGNLAAKIMSPDGLFLDIVKGVLDHDMKKSFTFEELESAKHTSLKIMYRIWFVAYAESRNLLPIRDKKYKPISLQYIRSHLDSFESEPSEDKCWKSICKLFEGIRNGSIEHNLPQYNGDLFRDDPAIDGISVKNKFITKALCGLLEQDGAAIDYADFSVRHLGNIFETLMEYSPRQTDKDIMLLVDSKGVQEVKTEEDSTYSYKKNDLYLASKGGIASRKTSASFYTPDEIVKFLVKHGLNPLFEEREGKIADDIKQYKKYATPENLKLCMDRILDIQVLDPSMGSGHFLVEALNQITLWATNILKHHADHPLLSEIESDRKIIIDEQKKNGITIDENLLTHDVLLKRKIMKRCIFGVDLNPLAVELAKVSLWLDSFAIGVPLTYINHHIRLGDSTIGVRLDEVKKPTEQTLDNWMDNSEECSGFLNIVGHNTDITMDQVKSSKNTYAKYVEQIKPHKMVLDLLTASKMDKNIIPKNAQKNIPGYFKRLADTVSGKNPNPDDDLKQTIEKIRAKSTEYRFFQWELEMMDAFTDSRNGFDLIIGNPPWDKVRPNANEFFQNLNPTYKKKSNSDKKKIRDKNKNGYKLYKQRFDDKREFYKNREGIGENTDFDLYRLIIERAFQILAPNGMFSMIMPSAIANSRGATALRKHILGKNIKLLYVFENSKKIFPIDSRQRFALLTMQNSNGSDEFLSGFYLHNLEELENLGDKKLTLSKKKIGELSPQMSMIYEVRNTKDYEIIQKLYSLHPRLEKMKNWQVKLGRELNLGEDKDKKLLVKKNGWPVLESKNFHQHIHNYSAPKYRAAINKTLTRVGTIRKFNGFSKEIHENPRLVYRSISASTNTRTMISCIVPQSVFTSINAYMALPRIGIFEINRNYHILNAYLCGIFNSTTYDFLIRPKIDKAVETYHIYDTPIPEDFTNDVGKEISKQSAILMLSETWHDDMADVFSISKNETNNFNLQKRIEITAKIDALCAFQYGLTKAEYEHVLENFKFKDAPFSETELTQNIQYCQLTDSERDKHMRIFYDKVYKRALEYFEDISNG